MNCGNWGKAVGALLVAVAVAGIAGAVAMKLVSPVMLGANVYKVEIPAEKTPVAADLVAHEGHASMAPVAEAAVPLSVLLASASAEAGKKTAAVCGACHSFGKGEAAKMGPNLYGIVGSKHAHMAGFAYSDAMKAMSGTWDFDEINSFITNPRAHLPGTKMTFPGLKKDTDRANVIAWLRTLSDSPVPLPK